MVLLFYCTIFSLWIWCQKPPNVLKLMPYGWPLEEWEHRTWRPDRRLELQALSKSGKATINPRLEYAPVSNPHDMSIMQNTKGLERCVFHSVWHCRYASNLAQGVDLTMMN